MSDIVIRGAGGLGGGGTKKPRTPVNTPDSSYLKTVNLATMQFLLCEGPIWGPAEGRSWNGLLASTHFDDTSLLVRGYGGTVPVEDLVLSFGTANQSPVPGYGTVWNTLSVQQAVKAGFPVFSTITSSDPNTPHRARVLLTWDALVLFIKENGDVLNAMVPYLVDYTDALGNVRVAFAGAVYGKFSGPFQREHEWDLQGPGPWTIRVMRMAADDDALETSMASFRSAFSFTSVSVGPVVTLNYKYSATLSVAARADRYSQLPAVAIDILGKIIKVPNNYDPWNGVHYGQWSGVFKEEWSDNPAWCFYDMVTNGRYGLGESIDPGLIDKWSLYQIGQYCDGLVPAFGGGVERRFRCNILYTTQAEAWEVLQQLASIFRGLVYWAAGTVMAIQEAPQTPVFTFSPANVVQTVDEGGRVTEPCFIYQGTAKRTRHTVALVSWDDPKNAYQPRVEYLADSDGLARLGYRPLEIRLPGITSKGQALRTGQWALLAEILLDETVTLGVGAIGAALRPGDLIKVADPDKAAVRYGGRIVAVDGATVTLDAAPLEAPDGWPAAVLSFQSVTAGGQPQLVAVPVVSAAGAVLTVAWPDAFRPRPREPWLLEFPNREAQPFRVLAVEERTAVSYTLTALRYRPDIFNAVDFGTPLYDDESYLFKVIDPVPPTIETVAITWTDNQPKLSVTWRPPPNAQVLEGFDLSVLYYRLQYQQGELQGDGTVSWTGQWQEVDRQSDTSELVPIAGYVATSRYQVRMAAVDRLQHDSGWSAPVMATPIEQWFPMPDLGAPQPGGDPPSPETPVPTGELQHANRPTGGHRFTWRIRAQIPPYVRVVELQARPDTPEPAPPAALVSDIVGAAPLGPMAAPRVAVEPPPSLGEPDAEGWYVLGTAAPNALLDVQLPWPAGWEVRARLLTFVPGLVGTTWMTDRIDRLEIVPPLPLRFTVVTAVDVASVATQRRFSWSMPLSDFPGWGPTGLVSDIAGYEVRFKRGNVVRWELGLPLYSDGITGDQQWFSTSLFNSGVWVVMLRPRDRTGWLSDDLVAVTVNLGDALLANVIERIDFGDLGFPGELENLRVVMGESERLYADPVTDAFYEDPLDDDFYDGSNGWRLEQIDPTLESQYVVPFTIASDGVGLVVRSPGSATVQWFIRSETTPMVAMYEAPTDQAFYQPPLSSYFYLAAPLMGGQFHPVAPFELLERGTYTLAGRIVSPDGVRPGRIDDLDLLLDVPDRMVTLEDVWVEPGGSTFDITPRMRFIKAANVTLQEAPGATARTVVVEYKGGDRVRLRALDAAGAPARALVDAILQGA